MNSRQTLYWQAVAAGEPVELHNNVTGKKFRVSESMEDNSFVPFELSRGSFPNNNHTASSRRIVKKSNVRQNGRYRIFNESPPAGQIECTPITDGGQVASIEVRCSCGCQTTIQLEYGE